MSIASFDVGKTTSINVASTLSIWNLGLGACDFDFVVPTEQADFLDICPVAGLVPEGDTALGAASGIGVIFLDRAISHVGIGPHRLALIANNTSYKLVGSCADSHSAQSFFTDRASPHINQIGEGHIPQSALGDGKCGDQVLSSNDDAHPFEWRILLSSPGRAS